MQYISPFTQYDSEFIRLYKLGDLQSIEQLSIEEANDNNIILRSLPMGKDRDIYSISLHRAIRNNDVVLVRKLVDKNVLIETYKSIRRYHIFIAALLPTTDVLSVLLEFDNEYHTRANHLMLHAASVKNLKLLKFAFDNGANPNEWRGKLFFDNYALFHSKPWLDTILEAGFFRSTNYLSSARAVFEAIYEVYSDRLHELPDGPYLDDVEVAELIFRPVLTATQKTPMDILVTLPDHLTAPCLRLLGR